MRHLRTLLALVIVCSAALMAASGLVAQEGSPVAVEGTPSGSPQASPAASPVVTSAGITLYAGGLANPRGFAWSPEGSLYVALAGSGGTTMTQRDSAHEEQYGPFFGGDTASVVRIAIEEDVIDLGCPVPVAGGLPSTRGMSGHTQGPAAVAFLGDQLYVLQDAGSSAEAFPDFPNGVYAVNPDGSVRLIADIKEWHDQNPVAHVPGDLTDESETFAMLPGEGFLWVLESNSGQVLKVTPEGEITRIADLSEGHPIPTGFALGPDSSVYVGFLTPAPYVDGSSKVVRVEENGTVTDVWTGLTMVTGLAVDVDGTLYALEMATGNTETPPFTLPGTGRIVRQAGPETLEEVLTGLDFPIAMAMGPDNALYVAFPAFGATERPGGILRVELTHPQPMQVSPDILNLSLCDIQTPVPVTPGQPTPMGTPLAGAPSTMGTPAAAIAATPNAGGKSATGASAVAIKDFAFGPATLTVPAGTTVTWTNLDSVAHTATADDGTFNSGNLNPNQSFSFRFTKPGTYTYNCSYHPNMQGTIVVT